MFTTKAAMVALCLGAAVAVLVGCGGAAQTPELTSIPELIPISTLRSIPELTPIPEPTSGPISTPTAAGPMPISTLPAGCPPNCMRVNLVNAVLYGVNLSDADLSGADLSGADLDFSVLSFSCCSLACKTDEKQRIQLMFHALAWMANAESITDEEKSIYNFALDYANKFHRTDVERLIKKED